MDVKHIQTGPAEGVVRSFFTPKKGAEMVKANSRTHNKINIKSELIDLSFLMPAFLVLLFVILIPLVLGVQCTCRAWRRVPESGCT